MAKVILTGDCGNSPICVAVPKDWSGTVELSIRVEKSQVKGIRTVKAEDHPAGPAPDQR